MPSLQLNNQMKVKADHNSPFQFIENKNYTKSLDEYRAQIKSMRGYLHSLDSRKYSPS